MLNLLVPHSAALIKTRDSKTLIIADPHLGWDIALRDKGIYVPTQTPKLLQKLIALLSEYKPDTLLILGDVKYSVVATKLGEWHDIPRFFMEIKKFVKNIVILRGNHDANLEPLLPEKVQLLPAKGTIIGDIGLFHGHKWPSPLLLKCKTMVMGHLHPTVILRDQASFKITKQVWVKANCNTKQLSKTLLHKYKMRIEGTPEETVENQYNFKPQTASVIIMPSFNDFLGGRPLNKTKPPEESKPSQIIGPVLRSEAVDLDNAEIYLLDGTFLGTLSQLRKNQAI